MWVDPLGLAPEGYIFNLPSDPNTLMNNGWVDVTHPSKAANTNMLDIHNPQTGQLIEFHPAKQGEPGWEVIDHYHIHNPEATDKGNHYLDKNGKSVPKGSNPSHIEPNQSKYNRSKKC